MKGNENKAVLDAAERRLLQRSMRFLLGIQRPVLLTRAADEGYTTAEQRAGWRYLHAAGGGARSIDDQLAVGALVQRDQKLDGERLAYVQQLDQFENTWFPRTRVIIRRVVPRDRRDAFLAAFFHQLEQQPLGPTVVDSVTKFVERVDGLAASDDPDAKRVRAVLRDRGLSDERIASIKKLLDQAKGIKRKAPAPEALTAEAIQEAREQQMEALEDLRDWYNDWATTLRSVFTVREQIALGLTQAKKRGAAADDDDNDDDDDDDGDDGEPSTGPT